MWLSPQLAVMTVSSSWGVWHCLAWQVTVRAQASSCPARAPRPLCPVSAGRVPAGCSRERGGRKELLSLIVPGSAGSDNSSFLPHASGPAVGPMGQGCSHGTTAWCGAGTAGGPVLCCCALGCWSSLGTWLVAVSWTACSAQPIARTAPGWQPSTLLMPSDALDAVCLLSCPELVPATLG